MITLEQITDSKALETYVDEYNRKNDSMVDVSAAGKIEEGLEIDVDGGNVHGYYEIKILQG